MTFNTIGKIKTSSGVWFDFNDPQPDQITIEDIAAALSKICRYNGHIPSFYSVAEHCCHVADWLDAHGYGYLAFAGLMHDAAEAYLGDIVNPMKKLYEFDRVYAPMEEIVEVAIGNKFNVDLFPINPIVKQADKAVYEWEVEHIRTGEIKGYDPDEACETFLAFFDHYKPPTNFTRESQMSEGEKRLMEAISDMESETNEDFEVEDLPLGGRLIVDEEILAMRKGQEVRITNPLTGGQKGSKLERFDLIPIGPLTELARHYGKGAEKYESHQWRKGYDWSLSYAALQRHLTAFWGGEDFDEETGSPHMVAVAWHAFTLLEYMNTCPQLDDRYKS